MKSKRKKYPPASLGKDTVYGKIDRSKIHATSGTIPKLITAATLFVESCSETDVFGVSAQMAFTLLFALLPTLLFIILICSQIIGNFTGIFLTTLGRILPTASSEYITQEIHYLLGYVKRFRVFIVASSAVMGTISARTIITSLNQTYGFESYSLKRWEWLKSFIVLLLLCLIVVILVAVLILTLYAFQNFLTTGVFALPGPFVEESVLTGGTIASVFVLLWGLYTFAPQRHIHFSESWPGAVFTTAGIFIVFEIYVGFLNRSANYLTLYGSLSGIFILLTALYFLSVIVNFGAKINVFFSRR